MSLNMRRAFSCLARVAEEKPMPSIPGRMPNPSSAFLSSGWISRRFTQLHPTSRRLSISKRGLDARQPRAITEEAASERFAGDHIFLTRRLRQAHGSEGRLSAASLGGHYKSDLSRF